MANKFIYDYDEAGFRIIPLWSANADGSCKCGNTDCANIYKHPRMSNWQHVPHWSEEQLDVMIETGQVDTGFGVIADDRLIVDVDPRNGGFASLEKLNKALGVDLVQESGFTVSTGGGGYHIYFDCPKPPVALQAHLKEYPGIDFKSGSKTFVVACGSQHKSGGTYETKKGNPCDLTEIPAPLLCLLKKPDHYRASLNGESLDVTEQEISDMLACVDADVPYDDWIKIGMSVHHSTNGDAFHLWNAWSSRGSKYNGSEELDRHWHSFGKSSNPVTIGTLFHFAETGGYKRPVTFDMPYAVEDEDNAGDNPFPVDTIDLLRPPGFVGKVTEWINSQCRFPREHLAVAGALQTIGNICGLRYTDDRDGVTTNLFTFGVSGSATGKEAIQTAMIDLHRAAGITAAVHGNIKSEQEITRNLIRHQCAFFVIDEIGYLLKKIANSGKSGASYLEGVIALLMSAYGKAAGYLLISGDLKEDIRKTMQQEYAQCIDRLNNNDVDDNKEFYEKRRDDLKEALRNIDDGLKNPLLSLIGFTTPVSFDGLVNFEQATNGFIGRSILVREHETNPKEKDDFKKAKLDPYMAATLKQLYYPGECSPDKPMRLEHTGERIEIKTTDAAWKMLKQVKAWINDYAEHHKGKSGLEAVVRRGYELCAKVSVILACPSGLRTEEHVRWAYALIRNDIDGKIELARRNQLEGSERADSVVEVLKMRIRDVCKNDNGEPISVICQRASSKKYTRNDVESMVQVMVDSGELSHETVKHPKSGRETTKYTSN